MHGGPNWRGRRGPRDMTSAWRGLRAKQALYKAAGLKWPGPSGKRAARRSLEEAFVKALVEQRAELVPLAEGGDDAAARLARANLLALDHVERFFEHAKSYDLDDLKAARLANDMALGVITRQIRVDDGKWRASGDVIGALLREIAAARAAPEK